MLAFLTPNIVEAMGLHSAIAVFDMVGQTHGHRRGCATLLALALQREAHGIGVRHAAPECFAHRCLELGAAIAIKQAQQRGGDAAQVLAAPGRTDEQLPAGWGSVGAPIGATVMAGPSLMIDQGLDVCGILDLRAPVITASVAGEHLRRIGDAYLLRVSEHREPLPNVGVGDGIVIQIEAHVGRLADLARDVTGTPYPLVDLHAVHPPPPSTPSALKQTIWKASRRYSCAPPQPKHSAASEVQFDSGAYRRITRSRLASCSHRPSR